MYTLGVPGRWGRQTLVNEAQQPRRQLAEGSRPDNQRQIYQAKTFDTSLIAVELPRVYPSAPPTCASTKDLFDGFFNACVQLFLSLNFLLVCNVE